MTSPRRDPPGSREILLGFLRDLPGAVRELELAVTQLLDSSWEEPLRRRAHEMSVAMADAAVASGLPYVASLARAISSLLGLRLEDTFSVQEALREKLRELLGLLKDFCSESGQSAQS